MITHIAAALVGSIITLVLLYWLGKRHQRHSGRVTGPNSRMPVAENVVSLIKKG